MTLLAYLHLALPEGLFSYGTQYIPSFAQVGVCHLQKKEIDLTFNRNDAYKTMQ